MLALALSSCALTDSGVVEYTITGTKGFVARYIDKDGLFQDTAVTKEQFKYKFMGESGDKVGASAVPTAVDGSVSIVVKHRGASIADGMSLKFLEPALAFSILK